MDRYSGSTRLSISRFIFAGSRARSALCAAALAAALFSFDPFDPTAFNLVSPAGGSRNWLGPPGALIGGTLVDLIGAASLLLPLLILNWGFARQGRPRARAYLWYGASLLLIAAALFGFGDAEPHATLWSAGLLGRAGASWVAESLGAGFGIAVLVAGSAYALGKVTYVVDWKARGREAGILLRAGFGSGEARAERAAMAAMSGGLRIAERVDGAIGSIGTAITTLRLGVRERLRAALNWLTRPRLPRPRAAAFRALATPASRPAPVAPPPAPIALDGFHSWFATVDEVEAAAREAVPPPAVPPAPAKAASPDAAPRPLAPPETQAPPEPLSAEWEKQVRAYSDNLDLDWEERVLKVNRMRRELFKWDDEEDGDASAAGGGKSDAG